MADAHTPLIVGTPWFSVVADEVCGKDAGGDVFVIAQLNPLQEMPDEVTAHHARLIASAPDLLEAAQHFVRWADEPAESAVGMAREQEWLEKARAAISKAGAK